MTRKICYPILYLIFVVSCDSQRTETTIKDTTSKTIKLTDSSRTKLVNALEDIIKSNATPGDTTITGKFVNQGKYDNGDFYITITTDGSTITLTNPMSPLKDDEIAKLKKNGNNITLTYNSSDQTVKFLSVNYESKK